MAPPTEGPTEHPPYRIRLGRPDDIPQLLALFSGMDYSRLHDLGDRFVRLLHRHMIASRWAVCLVAEQDGELLGYITGTTDSRKFAREFVIRHGWLAALLLAPQMLSRRKREVVLNALTYSPQDRFEGERASGLTFAVRRSETRRGIGTRLFKALMHEYDRAGLESFTFLTAGEPTAAANAFYKCLGCELIGTQRFYRDSVATAYRCIPARLRSAAVPDGDDRAEAPEREPSVRGT